MTGQAVGADGVVLGRGGVRLGGLCVVVALDGAVSLSVGDHAVLLGVERLDGHDPDDDAGEEHEAHRDADDDAHSEGERDKTISSFKSRGLLLKHSHRQTMAWATDSPLIIDERQLGGVGRRVDPDALAAATSEVDHGRLVDEELCVVGARVREVGVGVGDVGVVATGKTRVFVSEAEEVLSEGADVEIRGLSLLPRPFQGHHVKLAVQVLLVPFLELSVDGEAIQAAVQHADVGRSLQPVLAVVVLAAAAVGAAASDDADEIDGAVGDAHDAEPPDGRRHAVLFDLKCNAALQMSENLQQLFVCSSIRLMSVCSTWSFLSSRW